MLDIATNDFEEMAARAPNWDQEYFKLEKGPFRGHLQGIHTDRMQIGIVRRTPGILSKGAVPQGAVTMAAFLDKGGTASSQGTVFNQDHILVFKPGQEFEVSTLGQSTLLVVVVEESLFQGYALARWGAPFVMRDSRDRVMLRRRPYLAAMRQEWKLLLAEIARSASLLSAPLFARALEQRLLDHLLMNALAPEPSPPGPSRRQAAKRAEEYLLANIQNSVSMADLCAATKSSERTLLLGFNEVFGVSPKQFLKSLRLNLAKRDLRNASFGATVTDIAVRWGFTHLSRFAADYRTMFGESPRETLKLRP